MIYKNIVGRDPVFFFLFMHEPELGTEINPGVVLTPFPSSNG